MSKIKEWFKNLFNFESKKEIINEMDLAPIKKKKKRRYRSRKKQVVG